MPQISCLIPGQSIRHLGDKTETSHTEMQSAEGDLSRSIRLRSAHQLCLAYKSCLSHFCKSQVDPKRMKNNVLHSNSLSTVFTPTEGQCFICSQLRNRITELNPGLGPDVYSDYSIVCCWSTPRDEDKETKMWMILQLGLWSKKDFGQYFDSNTNHGECTDPGLNESRTDGTNDSDYTKELAISWLARCIQNSDGQHDICNKGDQDYIPTRLLDVQHALENNVVRLFCHDKEDKKFKGVEAYESRPNNGFGKHAPRSSVSVNGFLRKLRFDYSGPEEDDNTLSVVEQDKDAFHLTMDHWQKLPSCGLDCYALFTTLQETGDCGQQLSCVLSKHDSVVHNGPYQYYTYKRIGTMDNIGDLHSFKLRYRVAPSVKVPEASVSRMDSGDTCTGEDVAKDIWNLLSQYLICVRWDVISRFKESGMLDTSGYSSLEEDESEWEEEFLPSRPQSVTNINDKEEQTRVRPVSFHALTESKALPDDMNAAFEKGKIEDAPVDERHRQMLQDLGNIVLCIHHHPFSGLANITGTENAAEATDRLQQLLSFESQTVAYGTNIREDPGEVLYQFNDVLDMWQKTHGVGPWLERLETSVFTIV
ncbi:hypothetical protein NXS19_004880 [Fusarium pseudograminearum]|nr:hypothetical protein NXS19_004880 [Fusarium pseudograminearum]